MKKSFITSQQGVGITNNNNLCVAIIRNSSHD